MKIKVVFVFMMIFIALMHGCAAAGRGRTLPASAHVDCLFGCWCHDHSDCSGILNYIFCAPAPPVPEVLPVEKVNNDSAAHTECLIDYHCTKYSSDWHAQGTS